MRRKQTFSRLVICNIVDRQEVPKKRQSFLTPGFDLIGVADYQQDVHLREFHQVRDAAATAAPLEAPTTVICPGGTPDSISSAICSASDLPVP